MIKVIQYHPSVISADGIGNSIFFLHDRLREQGLESYIACGDDQVARASAGVLPLSGILGGRMGRTFSEHDVLLVHFSFLDEAAEKLAHLPLRRILVYHNITPGYFFREVGLDYLAQACDRGREQLPRLAECFHAAVGDSDFNSAELKRSGFKNVSTIPILLDLAGYRAEQIDPDLYLEIRAGAEVNIMFVGRFVPNKRIERVIATLAAYKASFPSSIHLHLVGKVWDDRYFGSLVQGAAEAGVAQALRFHLNADPLRLRTLYAAADAFVCMSDHEGFMIPLIEAFASGCPVIASDAGAVAETMGGAGLLTSAPDPAFAAGLVNLVATDRELRMRIVRAQARRAADFRPARTAQRWLETIRRVSAVA